MGNRLYAIISILLILASAYFYNEATKCQQPDKITQQLAMLKCLQKLDSNDIRQEACQKIYKVDDCEFNKETDMPVVQDIVEQMAKTCAIQVLQDANMCVDKITL